MRRRHITVILSAAALAAVGAGAAIGATSMDEGKKAEQEVLEDAAKRLDTSPEKLRDALGAALDAQLDEAVKDGDLTQEQADALKQRRQQSGRVLGFPGGPGGPGGPHHMRGPMGGPILDDVAKALGISVNELHSRLRDGKTLAQIAKAEGKSLADVKSAAKAGVKKRLDAAVKSGDITQKQADAMLEHLDEHLDRLGSARFEFRGRGFGPGGPGHAPRGGPILDDVAKALGISVNELHSRLRDGKTLAQIAKAEGKSLADVKSAAKAGVKKRLDAAVKSGDITQKQADAMLEHLDEHLDRLGSARFKFRGRHGGPGGPPPMPPPPGMEPGVAPAPDPGAINA